MRRAILLALVLASLAGLAGQVIISPPRGTKPPVDIGGDPPPLNPGGNGGASGGGGGGNAILTEGGDSITTEGGDTLIVE